VEKETMKRKARKKQGRKMERILYSPKRSFG